MKEHWYGRVTPTPVNLREERNGLQSRWHRYKGPLGTSIEARHVRKYFQVSTTLLPLHDIQGN